jgi:hypothetical protein
VLTPSAFDAIATKITDLYEEYNQSVINDIARRMVKMGKIMPSAAWQMQRLIESGKTFDQAYYAIGNLLKRNKKVLRDAFRAAGVKSIKFDDRVYKAVGLNPLPLNLSPAMLNVLMAGLEKTAGVVENFVKTTALDASQTFIKATDLAYMQVSSGAMSYNEAIRAGIKKVAAEGIHIINYATGHKDQLDVAMRRAVLTGVAQTVGRLSITRADELGCDLVQTSAHIGSRPTHEPWQGRVFSRSGKDPKYPSFLGETHYGEVDGLCGINCRHSFYPFYKDISRNAYTQETLREYKNKIVQYNGEDMSVYEAIQRQRAVEREIRKVKREANALFAVGLDNGEEVIRVKSLQAQMRDFIEQTKLSRQPDREGERIKSIKQALREIKEPSLEVVDLKSKQKPVPILPHIPVIPGLVGAVELIAGEVVAAVSAISLTTASGVGAAGAIGTTTGILEAAAMEAVAAGVEAQKKLDLKLKIPLGVSPTGKPYRVSPDGTTIYTSEKPMPGKGAFDSERVVIKDDGEAILKTDLSRMYGWGTFNIEQGFAHREVGAYELDQALGLNMVPRTTAFIENGEYKSLQQLVLDSRTGGETFLFLTEHDLWDALVDKEEPGKMILLDIIIANEDRHTGNWLVAGDHLYAIDNGLGCIRTTDNCKNYLRLYSRFNFYDIARNKNYEQMWYLPKKYRAGLQDLVSSGELKRILGKMLLGDKDRDGAIKLMEAAEKRAISLLASWDDVFTDVY